MGSSSVITDSTGAKVEAITYYPFGATRTDLPGTSVNVPYKYTGKELDASTGLYYYEARYYDPALGRFISADTIVPKPNDPQEFNRYTYAGNNPLLYTDPTGHRKCFLGICLSKGATRLFRETIEFGRYATNSTETGRHIMAGAIIVSTGMATLYCGGCGMAAGAFVGSLVGGALGGYAAERAGGDLSSGILFGAFAGAASGAFSGYVNTNFPVAIFDKFTWSAGHLGNLATGVGAHAMAGAGVGAASGATTGYAGGAGNWEAILTGSYRGAAIGAALGTVLAGAEYYFRDVPNYFDIRRYLDSSLADKLPKLFPVITENGILALTETSALAVGSGLELTQGILSRLVGVQIDKELRKGVKGHCTVPLDGGVDCGLGSP